MRRARFFLLLALTFAAACGSGQRQKTLRASFIAATAACDGLEAWDTTRQQQIVAAVDTSKMTREEGHAKLDEHQANIAKLYVECGIVYRAIGAASTSKDDVSFKAAGDEAQKLFDEIKKLKGAP